MEISGVDFRHMEVFEAVVRNRGFAAAEAELSISASTISNHITALEQRIGTRLCQRGRAGFSLTAKGEKTYALVRRFLRVRREIGESIASVKAEPPAEIRVGMVDSVATDPNCRLADAFRLFKQRMKTVSIVLRQDPPHELQMKVREGEYHCGLGSFPHPVSGLNHVPLYAERHYLYVGRGHPWFNEDNKGLRHEDLTMHDYVRRGYWRTKDYGPFKFGPERGVVTQIEPQLLLILSGGFLGFLPEHLAAPWVERSLLRRVLANTVYYNANHEFISRKSRSLPAAVKQLLECCVEAHKLGDAPLPQARHRLVSRKRGGREVSL